MLTHSTIRKRQATTGFGDLASAIIMRHKEIEWLSPPRGMDRLAAQLLRSSCASVQRNSERPSYEIDKEPSNLPAFCSLHDNTLDTT